MTGVRRWRGHPADGWLCSYPAYLVHAVVHALRMWMKGGNSASDEVKSEKVGSHCWAKALVFEWIGSFLKWWVGWFVIPGGMGDNIWLCFIFFSYLIFKLFVCSSHYPIGTCHPLLNVRESAVIESGTASDETELYLVSILLSPHPCGIL